MNDSTNWERERHESSIKLVCVQEAIRFFVPRNDATTTAVTAFAKELMAVALGK